MRKVKEGRKEGIFCTDGFKQIAPCTVKPSISRLETKEVYSWSSAAALPETHDTSAQSHSH